MRWMTAALILIPLNACIYYESGDCESCDGDWDDWGQNDTGLQDTELLAKVLRAVMAAEDITEDEEVAVLDALR